MYRIGIDISGGDMAPKETLKGAMIAKKELKESLILIGDKNAIEKEAKKHGIV